jgi:hypothetical protein
MAVSCVTGNLTIILLQLFQKRIVVNYNFKLENICHVCKKLPGILYFKVNTTLSKLHFLGHSGHFFPKMYYEKSNCSLNELLIV